MVGKWTVLFLLCVATVVDPSFSAVPMQEVGGYPSESSTEEAVAKFSQEKMGMDANGAKNAAHDFMENCKGAAAKSTNTLNSAANGAAKYLSTKASGAAEASSSALKDMSDKVSNAYASTKGSMSEQARQTYEIAKEKASESTGNLGAQMRGQSSEL